MFAHQSTEAWTALINALFEAGLGEIIFLEIDKSTGMLKNTNCPKADIVKMAFINGNHPTELCTEHP